MAAPAPILQTQTLRKRRRASPATLSETFPGLAYGEAKSFLKLLHAGETADSVRQTIGTASPYRRAVLIAFDILFARVSKDGKRLCRRVRNKDVSPRLRQEVIKLLRMGWSHARIRRALPIGPGLIYRLSKKIDAPTLKHGRGRRFTPAQWAAIRADVAEGLPSATVEQKYRIDYQTVQKMRRELGDYANRVHWRKLSLPQILGATQALKSGGKWRDVAAGVGVSFKTLADCVIYRKRDDMKKLSPEEIEQAIQLLTNGATWTAVAAQFGMVRATFQTKIPFRKREA
jgi:hypothetical protein